MEFEASVAQQFSGNLVGGAVLVRQGESVLLDRSDGLADRASQRPNTPETISPIDSVSKQFTATAVLLLHDRGALRLDVACGLFVIDDAGTFNIELI